MTPVERRHPDAVPAGSSKREPIVSRELFAAARSGDLEARTALVRALQPHVYRFCLYLSSSESLAQELAQETLVRVLEKISTVRDSQAFDRWVFRVARNFFLDRVKSAEWKVESKSDELVQEPQTGVYGLETEMEQADAKLAVRETLARMEPIDRAVLVLIDCEEFSHQEAADALGVTEASVRSRISRARKRFLQIFDSDQSKERK